MAEYLDVYDIDGNKKGYTVERGRHSAPGNWFLCVHVYIFTPDGKFLIQRRSLEKEYFPGIWDITCGAALAGETALDAAFRETKEELGLDVTGFKRHFVGKSRCFDCLNEVYFFEGAFELSELVLQKEEVMDAKFVSKDELIDLIVKSNFKDNDYHKMISDFILSIFSD